jgi:hypothetical protein
LSKFFIQEGGNAHGAMPIAVGPLPVSVSKRDTWSIVSIQIVQQFWEHDLAKYIPAEAFNHQLFQTIFTYVLRDPSPNVVKRLIGLRIRLHLRTKDDAEALVTVIPQLDKPVERNSIKVLRLIDEDGTYLFVMDRLGDICM